MAEWRFEDRRYKANGWEVWSNGFEWLVKGPDGHVYRRGFKEIAAAKRFAERRMK